MNTNNITTVVRIRHLGTGAKSVPYVRVLGSTLRGLGSQQVWGTAKAATVIDALRADPVTWGMVVLAVQQDHRDLLAKELS